MRSDFGYFEEDKLGKHYNVRMLKRLYPFAKPYKLFFLISIVLVILITLLELSLPYVTKIAIDRYIVPNMKSYKNAHSDEKEKKTRHYKVRLSDPEIRDIIHKYRKEFRIDGESALIPFDALSRLEKDELITLRKSDLIGMGLAAGVLLILVLAVFGLNFFQIMIMEYSGQMIMHDLRLTLYDHIQGQIVVFFTRNPVGRLVTRITNDVQNMNELFTSVVVVVFKDFFLLVGIAIVLLSIDWKLALSAFSILPLVLYTSFRFSTLVREAFRTLRIKIAEINTRFSETLEGMKIIQLFRQEKENYTSFKKMNHEHYLAGMKQIHFFAIFMPIIEVFGAIAIGIVIFYGGKGVLSDSISLGSLVAFVSYMRMFFRPLRDISEKYNITQNAMASAERIFLILDKKETLSQPTVRVGSRPPLLEKISHIEFSSVSFNYVPDEIVLEGVSFRVQPQETIAIVGPTGSGKTSLVNLIPRFYDPTSGVIHINGNDITKFRPSVLRSKMALVMQDPFLFSGTIRDNIAQGNRNISESKIDYILKASNCKSMVDKLQKGLNTQIAEGGKSMSSGERQLISIARAFALNPDLIILDEATSYVDSQTEMWIQDAMANLMEKRMAIIVAHRLSTARYVDRIIVLNRGKIIENGTHLELLEKKGFYFKLCQLQNYT